MTKIYLFYALMGTDGNALRHTSPVGMRLLGIFSVGIHGVPLHCRLLLPSRASHSTSAEDLQTSAIVSWGRAGRGLTNNIFLLLLVWSVANRAANESSRSLKFYN